MEEQFVNIRGRSWASESSASSEVERFMQEQRSSDAKKAWATLVPNHDAMEIKRKRDSNYHTKMVTLSTPLSHNSLSLRQLSTKGNRCPLHQLPSPVRISCSSASKCVSKTEESSSPFKELRGVACGLLAICTVATASPVIAANQRLPPLSTEPNRCERAFVGNTIGQANGVYDKPLDLRFCDYTNEKNNLKGKSLAAALMSDAKFDGADMTEAVMSKAYAVGASFKGTNFSNAVLDRVNFGNADLQGAVFKNTVLSGSTFDNAKLEDAVFEDTIIGYIDLQKLCTNKTISEEGRVELGCR
ncbi:thylakoid lumenal 17.4 kDa protein, chloroplastic [Corchorus capsularis]|uniref:Thylakoid lumenal 17.4 kDa protein, chloroplastic n=1 Tax=Corchorus capsularis TaxID=210143 RepID=A0A1R3IZB3_COCAP|nr:thylakoid lumenal 17.4 kDa protein, chloroplastic [Corchorus capsularis]